jgi:anti-sigma regulatory factor (Ser/Thr protein kinase)
VSQLRAPYTITALRKYAPRREFLGYAEGCLVVLVATLFSQRAHRAGLPAYLTLYPLAVASISALWGIRHGLFAALFSIVMTRVALVHHGNGLFPAGASESIRLIAISVSTLAAAGLVGVVREQRDQLERFATALQERQDQLVATHAQLKSMEAHRAEFCRDILLAVSHGKLRLCATDQMALPGFPPVLEASVEAPPDVTHLRHSVVDLAGSLGMEGDRTQDLAVCLGEATTNAIVHGGGGRATVYVDETTLWLHIVDNGPGIDQDELPRATLMKGYSTITSLGMGFSIMLELADAVCLATCAEGTQILIEMKIAPPEASDFDLAMLRLGLDEDWEAVPSGEPSRPPV